jgi:hypothetical protein
LQRPKPFIITITIIIKGKTPFRILAIYTATAMFGTINTPPLTLSTWPQIMSASCIVLLLPS